MKKKAFKDKTINEQIISVTNLYNSYRRIEQIGKECYELLIKNYKPEDVIAFDFIETDNASRIEFINNKLIAYISREDNFAQKQAIRMATLRFQCNKPFDYIGVCYIPDKTAKVKKRSNILWTTKLQEFLKELEAKKTTI